VKGGRAKEQQHEERGTDIGESASKLNMSEPLFKKLEITSSSLPVKDRQSSRQ